MKRLTSFILAAMIIVTMAGCGTTVQSQSDIAEDNSVSMFIEVEKCSDWRVVYHKDTKVMYAISEGGYSQYKSSVFTVLVNADGTPMVWNG